MARATHASGVSYTDHEASEPDKGVVIRRAEIGFVDWPTREPKIVTVELPDDEEEQEWQTSRSDGMDFSESSKSGARPTESSMHSDPAHAHTTESHSSLQDEGKVPDSNADSTGGSGRSVLRKRSSSTSAKKVANPRAARSRSISNDDDDFSEFE